MSRVFVNALYHEIQHEKITVWENMFWIFFSKHRKLVVILKIPRMPTGVEYNLGSA